MSNNSNRPLKRVKLLSPLIGGEPINDHIHKSLGKQNPEPTGRPTDYRPEFAKIAEMLCERGASDAVLAEAFNVDTSTIGVWRAKHSAFFKACMRGKEAYDTLAERTLAQRAIGYEYDAEEVKVTSEGDIVRYKVRKQLAPDVSALKFWLTNRRPKDWAEKQQITGPNNGPVQVLSLNVHALKGMSPQELALLERAIDKLNAPDAAIEQSDDDTAAALEYARSLQGNAVRQEPAE